MKNGVFLFFSPLILAFFIIAVLELGILFFFFSL